MHAPTILSRTIPSIDLRILVAYAALVILSALPLPFGWHLTLHVLGAAALIGNALVMAVWLTVAGFTTGDQRKRVAARAVILGDIWFTVPGVILVLTNGLAMVFARYGGAAAFTTTPFIGLGLVLLTLTGIVWAGRLVPTQLRLRRLSEAEGELDVTAYRSALKEWSVWGVIATALPIAAVVVMTTKPTF
jgi:uncharacterized membrane protein